MNTNIITKNEFKNISNSFCELVAKIINNKNINVEKYVTIWDIAEFKIDDNLFLHIGYKNKNRRKLLGKNIILSVWFKPPFLLFKPKNDDFKVPKFSYIDGIVNIAYSIDDDKIKKIFDFLKNCCLNSDMIEDKFLNY